MDSPHLISLSEFKSAPLNANENPLKFWERFLLRSIGLIYWVLAATWRVKVLNHPSLPPTVSYHYALWHGDELLLLGAFSWKKLLVLVSQSHDGERMKYILTRFGYKVVRGSSTRRGGAGLLSMINSVKSGNLETALMVDGPKGPLHKVKPGIFKLAEQTDGWIFPAGCSAKWKWTFEKSWNKCYLPLPFSKCVVIVGDPIKMKDYSDEAVARATIELEQSLNSLSAEANRRLCEERWPGVAR